MRGLLAFLATLVLMAPVTGRTESALPFMKELAGDNELPPPWGIGIDFYTMDQDYSIQSLQFTLPGVSLPDPSRLAVTNDVQHFDIKLDAWVLPFLNVFGIIGQVKSETIVDFSSAQIVGLPFPLGQIPFDLDGTVLGLGFTLAYGNDRWFTTLTTVATETDLDGDLDSTVESLSIQPRVGLVRGQWLMWLGGMYLDVEEKHSGSIALPFLGQVPFSVVLDGENKWNTAVGVAHHFSPQTSLSFELGFGDRTHTLFNFNYRF